MDDSSEEPGGAQQMVFGFLPAAVLQNINELGNWKTRSSAIEQVQHGLASLGPAQVQVLLQQLPDFVAFVQQLLQDHNFKVVIAGLHVLADAARSLGPALQHHLGGLAPVLLSKLLDHRAPVAAAALQAAAQLMRQEQPPNSPAVLVNQLLSLQQQQQQEAPTATQQDCSGLIELLILALLKGAGSSSSLDLPAAAALLLKSMQQQPGSAAGANNSKQHALAMEAWALLTDSLGAGLPNVLKQAGGSDLTVTLVLTQVQQLQRPTLAADGSSVQHNTAVQAAIAAAEASPPSSASFRIGAGLYDRTGNSSSASSFRSEGGLGLGGGGGGGAAAAAGAAARAFKSAGGLSSSSNSSSKGGGEPGAADYALGSRPLSGTDSAGHEQQLLPPGSLGALAAHARLLSTASSSIAAAAAASCGGGGSASNGGSRPDSGAGVGGPGRTSSHGQEARSGGGRLQLSLNSSSTSIGGHDLAGYTAGRSPLGSPRAASHPATHSGDHSCSHLQPPAAEAAVRGSGGGSGSGGSGGGSSRAAAAASAGQQQLGSTSPPSPDQQQQLRTQLSKLQVYDSSRYLSSRQDSQLQQDAAEAAATASKSAAATAAAGGPSNGSTSTSTWLAAAGPGWASPDPGAAATDASASGAYSPGRPETLSPSRGERLAQLKRRQVEKRAVSATGSSRGSSLVGWDSQSGGAAAAAQGADGAAEGGDLYHQGGHVPRASTAGPVLPAGPTACQYQSAGYGSSSSSSRQPGPQSLCSSPSPGDDPAAAGGGYHPSGGSSRGSLLQWHIPTGPGGRVLPPGSPGASSKQQQQQYAGSPEPGSPVVRGQLWDSPTASADGGSSSRAVLHSSMSPHSSGAAAQMHSVPRTVSAAAVLLGGGSGGSDAYSGSSSSGGGGAGGYGALESTTHAGNGSSQRSSSRFQQQPRSGSASPAPADGPLAAPHAFDRGASGSGHSAGSGGSRLHSGATSSGSNGFSRQQQPPQQQPQGLRAQTAAPAVGAANNGSGSYTSSMGQAGEWGTGTSSPANRLVSACGGPGGSGCFSSGSGTGGAGLGSASGAASPTRSPGGLSSSRTGGGIIRGLLSGERPQSGAVVNEAELAGCDLAPLSDPDAGLRQAVAKMQAATAATRKEVDWQAQLDALVDARRLIAHHTEVLRPSARELVLAALPSVDDLRSTTSRMALLFFQELPGSGVSFDRELDDVVPVLLKKAGDLSTAGRDNFLAQEAAKALSAICAAVSESRALSALVAAGASHKSPHVRSRAAAHLDEVAAGGRGLEAPLRNGNWAVLDKLFKTAAAFLQEGSLDTRTYGKRLLWAVKAVLRGSRPDMDRLMAGITPDGVHRRVVEVLEGLSGPPPPPASKGASSTGPRLASRGQASGCSTPVGAGTLSGLQTAPFSAPPGSLFTSAAAGPHESGFPYSAARPGYGSVGSTSSGSGAARRALFSGGSGTSSNTGLSAGLQIQGSPAAAGMGSPGSPGSPTLSSSASGRRRRTATALADIGRGGSSPSASACGSPAAAHGAGAAAFGAVGSTSGSGGDARRGSSGGGCPPGPPGPMGPELQEAVDQVGLQLCSKDWRNRMDALRALSALCPALPEVPNAPLEGLLQALIGRLSDGNAKVNQKALEVLCEVVCSISLRTLLIMSSLMPALTANLGSTNDKLRGCASIALDVVTAAVSPSPQLLMQGFSQAIANGSVRTRVAVIDKLESLLPVLHAAHPQLTRLLLPAAFSLAAEARGEAKAAAAQLMCSLAALLGSSPILIGAANVSSATEQRVRELLFNVAGRS